MKTFWQLTLSVVLGTVVSATSLLAQQYAGWSGQPGQNAWGPTQQVTALNNAPHQYAQQQYAPQQYAQQQYAPQQYAQQQYAQQQYVPQQAAYSGHAVGYGQQQATQQFAPYAIQQQQANNAWLTSGYGVTNTTNAAFANAFTIPTSSGHNVGSGCATGDCASAHTGGYDSGSCGAGLSQGGYVNGDCGQIADCADTAYYTSRPGNWYGHADALFLKRDRPDSFILIVDEATNTIDHLNMDQFSFDYEFGPAFTFGRRFGCGGCWGIEFGYFDIDAWEETIRHTSVSGLAVRLPGGSVAGFVPADIQTTYSHEIVSADINLVRDVNCWFTALFGVRWMQIDDHLEVDELDLPLNDLLAIDAANDMIGFQTGGYIHFVDCCRFKLDGFMKMGILRNSASTRVASNGFNTAKGNSRRLALFGEVGLSASYQISCNLAVRAGYQVLAINNVASAPDQIRTTTLVGPPVSTSVDDNSTAFYDGGFVGVEWCW